MAAGGGRSSSLNFGLNSVGFLHFPASTGGSGGWDWSGWKEEDGTVLLGPVPPQVVAGCGGGGPKTAAVNTARLYLFDTWRIGAGQLYKEYRPAILDSF
ncbi:hypothetical protein L3X38_041360 [Prunus dulcis]|uniref:Uncharacterized protein n=1 Tax=Prunus dulcis TaxID=3755 RepID=A0AAD4YJ17_PRUDU|nr:hypothetical protein L3X38_041360 [Prunus dulcis]